MSILTAFLSLTKHAILYECVLCKTTTVYKRKHFNFFSIFYMLNSMSMVHHCKYPLFVPYLDIGAKVTRDAAQYPLHHVNYAPAKFGVAECNPLGDVFTRKYINQLLTLRSILHEMLSSTLYII